MTQEKFDCWCLLELFGHQKLVGRVQEVTLAGGAFLQVDVPETKLQPAFTRIMNPSAIYALNPITEDVARQYAENIQAAPIKSWDVHEFMKKVEQKKLEAQHSGSISEVEYEVEDQHEEDKS